MSIVAVDIVGRSGQVHSFEPVPEYFSKLINVKTLNKSFNITVNQCALGSEERIAKIALTNLSNIGWNTIVPSFMNKDTIREVIEVPIYRFDDYVKEKSLRCISLVKIDTEGYEFPVLKGFSGFFDSTSFLPVIICEIVPTAYPLLGFSLNQFSEYMRNYRYEAFDMQNMNIKIDIQALQKTTNVIFMPCNFT